MRFIHMGDVHLGAEPESGTGLGPIRKQEIWEAFRDVISLCEREGIELLLIPGDLFHGQPLLRDVKEVDYLFRTLTKTRVVMIAGNHDCLLKTSHYYDVTFPEHVSFLMDYHADSVYLPELNVEVFGASYETKQIPEARYDRIKIKDASRINILLAHGNIMCTDKSIPIHKEVLEAAGFDYIALGHLHTRVEVGPRMTYSGGFEPFERKESGPKGYIAGELLKNDGEESQITWHFVPHAKREYVPLRVEVTPQSTEFSLCEQILHEMELRGMQHMYLVTLSGRRSAERSFLTDSMAEIIRSRGGILIELTDETVPDFDLDLIKKEHKEDFVGRIIRRLEVTGATDDAELADKALLYGLQALMLQK